MKVLSLGILIAAGVLGGAVPTTGQQLGPKSDGWFPLCRAIHIDSPNRRWALASNCFMNCPYGKAEVPVCPHDHTGGLFLESASSHRKRPIAFYGYAGNAVWSPDSAAFFVNDHIASDETNSALYAAVPFRKIDVAEAIRRSDPAAVRYFQGHRYFIAQRWLDNRAALVQFCGHTDEAPVVEFDFHYRVGIDGSAQRISRRLIQPSLDHPACE